MGAITLQALPRPKSTSRGELLDYLLATLGLRHPIYREIIVKVYRGGLTSGELARGVAKRTTVIYHVDKLVRLGLLEKRGRVYRLRGQGLEQAILHIKREVERILADLLVVARELDRQMGVKGW